MESVAVTGSSSVNGPTQQRLPQLETGAVTGECNVHLAYAVFISLNCAAECMASRPWANRREQAGCDVGAVTDVRHLLCACSCMQRDREY